VLKYKSDIRSLIFLGLYYSTFIVSWWVLPFTWQAMVPAVLLLCTLNFMVAITIHNTIHCPIFKKRWANRLHFILLSLAFGSPASGYVPGHNLSHHKHLQTAKDNTRTWKMRFRWNFLNQLLFFFVMIPGIIRTESRFVKIVGPEKPKWHKQYRVEVALSLLWKLIFLALDPWRFLFLLILPNLYAVWGIFGTNFWQHDGCDESHPYNHSRNFTGKLFNFLVCNNGYHGAHHMRPNMHWSLYPAFHEKEIKPYMHPALDQKSILVYLWKTCVYPGKRLTFEGREVVLPPNVPDEDWVAEVGASSWKAEDMAEA
jgi:beta-carotene hydroxylase